MGIFLVHIHLRQSLKISGCNVDEEDGGYLKMGGVHWKDLGVGHVGPIIYETSKVIYACWNIWGVYRTIIFDCIICMHYFQTN